MYAIIEDGGKQYKVEQGSALCVEVRDLAEGQTEVEFDKVLFVRDDQGVQIGNPYLKGAKVTAKISGQAAGPKVHPMKFRRRKNSKSRTGHRQKYLDVEITAITR
ncbi:MAG: 50S ribosomal protein L21 [Sedimentisphaerales bacterium]|nr:50S ribosomal protein L21 [Sedimentisphaerales bacterium]